VFLKAFVTDKTHPFSGNEQFSLHLDHQAFSLSTCFVFAGKNASFLRLVRGRSLAEECEPSVAKANELGTLSFSYC